MVKLEPAGSRKPAALAPKAIEAAAEAGAEARRDGRRCLRDRATRWCGLERTAFYDAMAGVRGLGSRAGAPPPRATAMKPRPAPATPTEREGDRDARAKLASLVSGGIHFDIRREDDWQAGIRRDAPRGTLENRSEASPGNDASLDLHGRARCRRRERASRKLVRRAHQLGLRRLRIVHGQGPPFRRGGTRVLGEAVIESPMKGAAAARVIVSDRAASAGRQRRAARRSWLDDAIQARRASVRARPSRDRTAAGTLRSHRACLERPIERRIAALLVRAEQHQIALFFVDRHELAHFRCRYHVRRARDTRRQA